MTMEEFRELESAVREINSIKRVLKELKQSGNICQIRVTSVRTETDQNYFFGTKKRSQKEYHSTIRATVKGLAENDREEVITVKT